MQNKVNNTSSGVSSRQSIIKWLLILLFGMQLASFVSNLSVTTLGRQRTNRIVISYELVGYW